MIPGIVFGIVCSFFNKYFENLDVLEVEKKEEAKSEQNDDWSGFIKLCGVVFSRSILSNGISTFLAFYFIQQFSKSNSFASMLLSVFYIVKWYVLVFVSSYLQSLFLLIQVIS